MALDKAVRTLMSDRIGCGCLAVARSPSGRSAEGSVVFISIRSTSVPKATTNWPLPAAVMAAWLSGGIWVFQA